MKSWGVWILVALVAVLLVVFSIPRIKQAMLPDCAAPERFEELFAEQLAALRAVAEGTKQRREVAALFADPAIEGAEVVNSYGDAGSRAVSPVKRESKALSDALEGGLLFPTHPGVDRAVVNVWGGGMAIYEVQFETAAGELRGYTLAVGLANLERLSKERAP